MTEALLIAVGLALAVFVVWALRSRTRPKSGPDNNWRNEDHLSRAADGTWAEGSTSPKTQPSDSSGLGIR